MPDIQEIDQHLTNIEAGVPNLRRGCEKQVVWAGQAGVKTPVSLLFIHGFSASPGELRPLPDLIAKGLGANLYLTRLTGHGQDGAAMATASLADWQRDVAEAIEIAQTIGDDIVLMGCSTGCTLATLALSQGIKARGVIHVSPNFGLTNWAAQTLLDLPGSRHWGKYLVGRTRRFDVVSYAHATYWTTSYPTEAVSTMADTVRMVRKADLSQISTPAFFAFNERDQVVNPTQIRKVIARWGGPTEVLMLEQGPSDDVMGHVMAGDVFSPEQTEPLARRILAWFQEG